MLSKRIVFFGDDLVLACDGLCSKAFGINGRPRRQLSSEADDYVYLPDSEVGQAPPPGETVILFEGGHRKPCATILEDAERMNKWCARECERSTMAKPGESIDLPDMECPEPNMRRLPVVGVRTALVRAAR